MSKQWEVQLPMPFWFEGRDIETVPKAFSRSRADTVLERHHIKDNSITYGPAREAHRVTWFVFFYSYLLVHGL
jgi:hypothetical protein